MASTIYVNKIPADIMKAIAQEQGRVQESRGTRPSQSQTVVKMLRDYLRCRKDNKFNPDEQQ
jgi:hypothetical protein